MGQLYDSHHQNSKSNLMLKTCRRRNLQELIPGKELQLGVVEKAGDNPKPYACSRVQ